jgi:hypothetical protein
MKQRKYERLVYQFTPEYNEAAAEGVGTDYVYSPQAYFRGASQIPGSKYNVGFQIFVKPFDFDAEISLCMGEEMEEYIITQPTIVRIPPGITHCPLNFKRIDKPVFFQAALMQGMFGGVYNGKELYYNGPGNCVYDDNKKCDSCKKCLEDDWDK